MLFLLRIRWHCLISLAFANFWLTKVNTKDAWEREDVFGGGKDGEVWAVVQRVLGNHLTLIKKGKTTAANNRTRIIKQGMCWLQEATVLSSLSPASMRVQSHLLRMSSDVLRNEEKPRELKGIFQFHCRLFPFFSRKVAADTKIINFWKKNYFKTFHSAQVRVGLLG